MYVLCFGTFFTLLIANKKDWNKDRRPEVSNRVLYAALFDIVDKHADADFHVKKAVSNKNGDHTDDAASRVKLCKDAEISIQRRGNREKYINRFKENCSEVFLDFSEFIKTYLDETQLERLTRSVVELIADSCCEDIFFHIGLTFSEVISGKEIAETKVDFNVPSLLAGVLFYILDKNIANNLGRDTITTWLSKDKNLPCCPTGESITRRLDLTFDVPTGISDKLIVSDPIKKYTTALLANKLSVLILDDDVYRARQYASALNSTLRFQAEVEDSINQFFAKVAEQEYDAYVLDINMWDQEHHFDRAETQDGWRTGLAVFQELRGKRPDSVVAALTHSEIPEVVEWFTSDDSVCYFYKEDYPPKKFAKAFLSFLGENTDSIFTIESVFDDVIY